ncbi:MAG: alpha/beta fold hydrolase, partial [Betaproteobacteria bacterium]|nr:alpha/beta fold hydrolase [Betaproteobacteria bacterium]
LSALRAQLFERGEPGAAVLAETLAMLADNDLRPELSRITVPALVIGGDRDALVPLDATRELAAGLRRGVYAPIPGAAHAPFLSHPRAFVDALASFDDG